MRPSGSPFLWCLFLAGWYVYLFHGQAPGINLLLFEVAAALVYVAAHGRRVPPFAWLPLSGTFMTALAVAWHASALAVLLNLVSAGLTVGILLAPTVRALHRSAALAMAHLAQAPRSFLQALPLRHRDKEPVITPGGALSVAMVPLVLLLFAGMYRSSNPHFDRFLAQITLPLSGLDLGVPASFLVGLLISSFLLLGLSNPKLLSWAHAGNDQLPASGLGQPDRKLRGELLTAKLLLVGLNVLLLAVNALDLRHVWLGFEFNGQYLKQFVHEGTYMLLLSILLGAGIVLYFFRGDLNFLREARGVKWLAHAWLGQNLLLALSVGMRNYWYIHYYALAYKRIGVAFFLLALCIGLVLVMLKVRHGRSGHYLLRMNAMVIYGTALALALFNWDGIMARYNMAQQGKAFVHLDFLAGLSDKALPWLVKTPEELEGMAAFNATLIAGAEHYSRDLYLGPEAYRERIGQRVQTFRERYVERSWKAWNLADARAYRLLGATARR